ncbi:MAG: hypothetical protein CHACPFDD_03881 [Phycisphaerae bacterium]|nr:hypothetical protein [Phycisphaerae bacterium]
MKRISRCLAPGGCIALSATWMICVLTGCGDEAVRYQPLPEPYVGARQAPKPAPPPPPVTTPEREPVPLSAKGPSGWMPARGIVRKNWKTIVVHHSANASDTPDSMHRYHLLRGWENGLGYHFVIGNGVNYPDGQVYVGPRWSRQQPGAHCATKKGGMFFGAWRPKGFFNDHGIGICLIGNLNRTRPTAKQVKSLQTLVRFLTKETGIGASQVYGHGHITHATECPGKNLSLAQLRQVVSAALASAPHEADELVVSEVGDDADDVVWAGVP